MKSYSAKASSIPGRGSLRTALLGGLLSVLCLVACESIYDDLSDCRSGIRLAFNYDYHMEPGANAFPLNVDCVTVYVFDPSGNYLTAFTETSDVLMDEGYRMELPLDEGDYHLVVYGGTSCEDASVEFTPDFPGTRGGRQEDIRVTVPTDADGVSAVQLHDIEKRTGGLFYGTLDVSITKLDVTRGDFREETVHLMKDTNNIQVILQELSNPYEADYRDYNFYIVDDNFVLDGYNNAVRVEADDFRPCYRPYASDNRIMGYVEYDGRNGALLEEDSEQPVQVACAEFSTSRLFVEHLPTARLVVTSAVQQDKDGNPRTIIDIPLIRYLTAIRGFGDAWIKSDQEFLDRQSRWTMMFFLQKNVWVNARISVNWWTVRINDIELDS